AVLIVIFGFFFATVSSRICGQIGSSANPISGMTIAALLGTCLIFVAIGWTGVDHRVQAISIAAVVAVATANAGNTSQDLKTGFLVGSTPRNQQIAILIGALGSALVVGWTLTLLNRAYTYPVPETHAPFGAQALAPTAGGRAPVEILPATMARFRIAGSDSVDHATYQVVRVYVVTDGVAAGKYLMDPKSRELRYVLDPGIGGRSRLRARAGGGRGRAGLRRRARRASARVHRAGGSAPLQCPRLRALRTAGSAALLGGPARAVTGPRTVGLQRAAHLHFGMRA